MRSNNLTRSYVSEGKAMKYMNYYLEIPIIHAIEHTKATADGQ